jgi:growth factor-regulated tyrosine kinase substrate
MPLPRYGITQEVRVCDGWCYNKLTNKANTVDANADKKDHQHHHSHSHRSAAQDLEDAELQPAIELSLEASRSPVGAGYTSSQPERWQASEPPIVDRRTRPVKAVMEVEEDPDPKAEIEAAEGANSS